MSNDDLAEFVPTSRWKSGRRGSGLIVHTVAWAFVVAFLAFVVPKFEAIFKDFGLDLSWSMTLIVRASHRLFLIVSIVLVLLKIDKFVLDSLSRRKNEGRWSLAWRALMLGLPLLILGLMLGSIVILSLEHGTKLTR